ncbi:hypothetical protein Smp_086110 [Schistosoma mansoni]|uniref:hypothetical protein n=1 Tax=Schistosoma mansoni TaxID=6183 RepID=UPI00022DC989|nr:hypothetical protein Smp_086110 [Schistosoma mansoni]|eukprot:XP_018654827.1 hypothetical protein Smp_086110 [Schistosoma mansoni]
MDTSYENEKLILKNELSNVKQKVDQFNKFAYNQMVKSHSSIPIIKLNNNEFPWINERIYLRPMNKIFNHWNSNEQLNSKSIGLPNITNLSNINNQHNHEGVIDSNYDSLSVKGIFKHIDHKSNKLKNLTSLFNETSDYYIVISDIRLPNKNSHLKTVIYKLGTVNGINLINMDLMKSVKLLKSTPSPIQLKIQRLNKINLSTDINCEEDCLSVDTDTDEEAEIMTKIIDMAQNYASAKRTEIKEQLEMKYCRWSYHNLAESGGNDEKKI